MQCVKCKTYIGRDAPDGLVLGQNDEAAAIHVEDCACSYPNVWDVDVLCRRQSINSTQQIPPITTTPTSRTRIHGGGGLEPPRQRQTDVHAVAHAVGRQRREERAAHLLLAGHACRGASGLIRMGEVRHYNIRSCQHKYVRLKSKALAESINRCRCCSRWKTRPS